MSLELAVHLDRKNEEEGRSPAATFSSSLYRQPSLAEGDAVPEPYRRPRGGVGMGSPPYFTTSGSAASKSRLSMAGLEEDDEDEEALQVNMDEVLGRWQVDEVLDQPPLKSNQDPENENTQIIEVGQHRG